nr:hypothetical protein [Tanacetum cinerariifolium]
MNKLVKGNRVRGLPSKIFKNDHTCVACKKGNQHKASSKKDETFGIPKDFITGIENQLNHKVKIIRCDNATEFKNYEMNQFCGIKGIKREFSNARTPQQNGVAERKNRTLIEAARTMVLVTKPHNKTPYELLIGRAPIISFIRPFGCLVTILNTLDHLGKFDGKDDEGFLVGYSINSKAFRLYNSITKKVEENPHVNFLENIPNVVGSGLEWLFDIDSLTNSMNYQPISAGNRTNGITGSKIHSDVGQEGKEKVSDQEYILLPVLNTTLDVPTRNKEDESSPKDDASKKSIVEPTFNAAGSSFIHPTALDNFSKMPNLEDTGIFDDAYDDRDEGAKMEPKTVTQALDDESWVEAMQEELLQFKLLNVWTLGHREEEGINYDEVFAPVARIKAIRLLLAYASFMDFIVYQMDVKSAFLYGTIEEEVYVSQPPNFVDLQFPDKVYKVEKALYGLHQSPRAWYETLSNYLWENRFRRGTINKTLFIKKIKNDILLVQMYVDDIIFGSTKRSLSTEFEQLMHNRFQMSSIGELTFFLRLVKSASTPMETHKPLSKDSDGTNTMIHVDNESAICVVKNPVYHSKTKHIEIRHHFIRESYKKRLIEMVKIHTNFNVPDLLTKAFDVTRFQFLVASIVIKLKGYFLNDGYTDLVQHAGD